LQCIWITIRIYRENINMITFKIKRRDSTTGGETHIRKGRINYGGRDSGTRCSTTEGDTHIRKGESTTEGDIHLRKERLNYGGGDSSTVCCRG
jgi:hypothetical protein